MKNSICVVNNVREMLLALYFQLIKNQTKLWQKKSTK